MKRPLETMSRKSAGFGIPLIWAIILVLSLAIIGVLYIRSRRMRPDYLQEYCDSVQLVADINDCFNITSTT